MKTTPTLCSTIPTLTDDVLAFALDCLQNHIRIETQDICSLETLFIVLLRATNCAHSIKHTAQHLTGIPTGNNIQYHPDKLNHIDSLETQLNKAPHHQPPANIINHRHKLAIDLHLIPYYSHPNCKKAPYIHQSEAKAKTTSFFDHTTTYLIRPHHRLTLAIHPVRQDETLIATITHLLSHLTPLKVKIQYLFLNRELYSVPVTH